MLAIMVATVLSSGQFAEPPTAKIVASLPATAADSSMNLLRAPDGLFYVTGSVNGVAVRFLVDTGASTVVLTRDDALRAGLYPRDNQYAATADTANGQARMTWVGIDSLQVAGTSMREVSAAVAADGLSVSLLGQSWLSQLASLTITGDRMLVR